MYWVTHKVLAEVIMLQKSTKNTSRDLLKKMDAIAIESGAGCGDDAMQAA